MGSAPTPVSTPNQLKTVIGRGSLSKIPGSAPGPRHFQAKIQVPLRGRGAAYSSSVKPKVGVLLRACGMQETVVTSSGSESVTYKPRSSGIESMSFYYNWDGLLYKLLGAQASVNFIFKTGAIAMADFDIQGLWSDPADVGFVNPTGEPTALVFPTFLNGAFQIGIENYAAPFQAINLNLNNTLTPSEDPSHPDGRSAINLVDRDPNGSFDPDAVLVATHDWYGKWKAGTIFDMSFSLIGPGDYNTITVSCPQVQAQNITAADRGGLGQFTVPFQVVSDSAGGDDELVLSWVK